MREITQFHRCRVSYLNCVLYIGYPYSNRYILP